MNIGIGHHSVERMIEDYGQIVLSLSNGMIGSTNCAIDGHIELLDTSRYNYSVFTASFLCRECGI